MESRESLQLKHTNVSQPQLARTRSQQSLTASEDFYSLSSRSSTRSDTRSDRQQRNPLHRYTTPPSRFRTPTQSYEGIARPVPVQRLSNPIFTTAMRGVGRRRVEDDGAQPPIPPYSSRRGSPIKRKPVPSTVYENSPRSTIVGRRSPLGSHPPPSAMSSTYKEIATEDNPPSPTPQDDAPYIHFALDSITKDQAKAQSGEGYSGQDEGEIGLLPFEQGLSQPPYYREEDDLDILPIPPRNPRRSTQSPSHVPTPSQVDIFQPFEPAEDSFHQPLTARPSILKPLPLGLFILLLVVYLVLLLIAAIWSRVRTGLADYGSFGDGNYFVFQYLPTMLGMALLLWLFEIEAAVYRLAPFIALASDSPSQRCHGPLLPLCPAGYGLPSFAHFAAGQHVPGSFLLVSWISLFSIPLLASSFNVYNRDARWMWVATQGTIWTVIVLYILLLAASVTLFVYLHRRRTGLKWDARSLADLLALIERSNALDNYDHYPRITTAADLREQLMDRHDRLGYWQSAMRPNEVFHAIAAPEKPARRDYDHVRDNRESQSERYSSQFDMESGRPFSYGTNNTQEPVLPQDMADSWQSHVPWFLRTFFASLWVVIAVLLLLAFLVVSYLPSTLINNGFLPRLPVLQDDYGFSSANFLYSFIPSLLGLLCLLVWQPFDLAFRRLQPYASLSKVDGALAEECLLISYPADGPVLVTVKAFANRHYRVAIVSLTTLIAATLPILAGGVFWEQFYISQQRVRISAHMPAFHALTVFATLYALSYFLVLRAGGKRRLPNQGKCLADVIAFVHQSRILDDPAFRQPATKTALVTRLLSAQPTSQRISIHGGGDPEKGPTVSPSGSGSGEGEQGVAAPAGSKVSLADSLRGLGTARRQAQVSSYKGMEVARYGFGRYMGRDGREWLGIDRIGRQVGGEMVVRE